MVHNGSIDNPAIYIYIETIKLTGFNHQTQINHLKGGLVPEKLSSFYITPITRDSGRSLEPVELDHHLVVGSRK
jgi:hypothetical protein